MPSVASGQITITDQADVISMVLSSDSFVVATNSDGSNGNYTNCVCTLKVLHGFLDETSKWNFSVGTPVGLTGVLSSNTYTVSGATLDSSSVDITATRSGYPSITKRLTVVKARAGATGASGVSAVTVTLTNTAHTVPTDSAGNNGNFSGCTTTLNVFNGATNDSANWTVTAAATNLTGSLSGKTYTVTALSADSGYVDLTAARSGFTSQTARFTVTKAKAGVAGQTPTAYWLVRSAGAVRKSVAGVYTPAALTFTAKSQTGTAAPANYAGRFVISTSSDGSTWTAAYTSASDESSKAYTVPASIAAVKVVLYQAGGTSTVLDEEIIPVVVDGATGAQGVQGVAGENFVINYATSELWAADTNNAQALGKYGGNFTVNGDGNQRVWATDPFGRPALTWRTVGNDAASDADGGWDKQVTGLDPEKAYMSVVYVRRISASTNGMFFHGCGKSGSTVTVEGAASSNPYFAAAGIGISFFDTLDWYVSIGFIKASADWSASSEKGGLYKLSTGAKVWAYSDFRMAAGATTQSHRTYLYYSTDPNASLEWWGPGFFEINGNEPKLRDLVGNPEWYNGNIAIGSDGTLSGGGGGKVTIGGLGYTGALDANKTSVDASGALQGVASGAGTVVSNAKIGINASGELYGTGTALTKVSNNQIYVDTSGAIQGISSTSSGLSVANNTDNVIRAPEGGVYTTRTSTITGRLKIALPQSWSNTMMRFTVEIYEYIAGYMCTLEIGGYNNETNGWVHVTARVIGGSNVEYPVYFGHDGSKCCIWVGSVANETWAYPQVRIRDFFAAYANFARTQWESGWVISFDQTAITSGKGANQYSASVLDTLPGADWAKVSGANRPANNATVGATWGTNVSSIPSNISTAGSTPTVDLRNNQIGLNASGQLYGAGAGNGTTVSNAQISVDTATGVIGGIGTGAGTAVANSQVAFSARQTWEFRNSSEGWVAGGSTLTTNADTITLTSTGTDPTLSLSGLTINGAVYDKLRMRVRRVAGTGWDGAVYFGTSATSPNTHGNAESYKKTLTNSLLSTSFVMLEWDMANLTAGGDNWKTSTITSIRFDLGSTASDVFEIDWISIGKYGHDVDLVLSASSQIIAGTDTNGVILDAASKSLQVVTGGNERVRLGNQAAEVNGSNYGFVVKDNSGNVVFDSRNAVGIVGNQVHDNYNLGDSSTNPFWNTDTRGVGNVAIGALALRGDGLSQAAGRSYNVAIGYQALRHTTVGTNVAIGYQAGRGNPAGFSGNNNVVVGYNALVNGTTATRNVAIGRDALRETTSGSENTAIGFLSQATGDIASYNTSLGCRSLQVAAGNENTAVGHHSGYSLNTGSNNTFVGKDAGYTITSGSGNTFIGYKAYTGIDQSNQTIIASGAGVVLKHSETLLETSHNFASGGNITATGTVKGGAVTVEGSGPVILLSDADATQSKFWIHTNNSKFYILTDYNFDGNWDTPYPLVLDNATTTASIYGQKVWTAGNDGAGSGLDADLLDGYQAAITATASTAAVRDGSGDIHTRLIRSEYGNENTISGAMAYRVESTSGGNNYIRFCSNTAAIRTYLGVAAATHSHTTPVSGNRFNNGFVSVNTDGVSEMGRYIDWHYASTDTTDFTSRTEIDSAGLLIHSQGLKVKGTGGLGYAFGGAVTQLTSRDTGVTLDTPSGTITLFSTAVTAGTMNKFTLTNSCIAATDVVMVCMRGSGTGRYNVFVDRVVAGACDIRLQNQATTASESCSINFAIIKGNNS